jgi:biopolymer transport protein ExbD
MPKNPKIRRENHSDPELDISSLIDVSFLLLIFFLVSSTLMKSESDLGLTLPGDMAGGDPDPALLVAIADDGRITVGGQELVGPSEAGEPSQVEALRSELVEFKKRAELLGDEPLVSLDAASGCKTQRFIDVINALSFAKIDRIAMNDGFAAN